MNKTQESVTALIEIKVTPKAKYGYSDIAKTIAQFKEVDSVHLMSGNFDLILTVKCDSLQKVGRFVDEHLSALDGVLSTATHFVIGCYKESGEILNPDEDDRGMYTV